MSITATAPDPFLLLLTMSRANFAARLYQSAYNDLLAALHLAASQHDTGRVQRVAECSKLQREWLVRHDPGQSLAPDASGQDPHGRLIRQAEAIEQRLQGNHFVPVRQR